MLEGTLCKPFTSKKMLALPYLLVGLLACRLVVCQQRLQSFDDWAHQRVALSNCSIHFRRAGSGPPVLLIHGVPEHSISISNALKHILSMASTANYKPMLSRLGTQSVPSSLRTTPS